MFNIGHATKRNFFKKKDYEIQVEYVNHNKTYVTVFRNIETYIIKLMILKVHFNTIKKWIEIPVITWSTFV